MGKHRNPINYTTYNWDANGQRISGSDGFYYSFPQIFNLKDSSVGTKWYWNKDGLLQESINGEPRFDWNPMPDGSTPKMPDILLEPASTNLANDRLSSSGTTSWIRTSLVSSNSTQPSPDGRRNGIVLIPFTTAPQPATNQYLERVYPVYYQNFVLIVENLILVE